MVQKNEITRNEYNVLASAYDFFNAKFFGGILPGCMITLQRKSNTGGYYSKNRFKSRTEKDSCTDEIALNPDHFHRFDEKILSTLAHEMVHLWQDRFGKPGRGPYHNKEWAAYMESIGLMPSDTGEPGGDKTGDSVSHYIMEKGPFEKAAKIFLKKQNWVNWKSTEYSPRTKKTKLPGRIKYKCTQCNINVWAKPNLKIICGECHLPFKPILD